MGSRSKSPLILDKDTVNQEVSSSKSRSPSKRNRLPISPAIQFSPVNFGTSKFATSPKKYQSRKSASSPSKCLSESEDTTESESVSEDEVNETAKLLEENKKLESQKRALDKQLGTLKSRIQKMETRTKTAEESVLSVKTELQTVKTAAKHFETKAEQENKKLSRSTESLMIDIESRMEEISSQKTVIKDLRKITTEKNNEIVKMQRELDQATKQHEQLRKQNEEYKIQVHELTDQYTQDLDKQKRQKERLVKVQAENAQIKTDIKNSTDQFKILKVEFDRVKQKSQKRKHMETSNSNINSIVPLLSVLMGSRGVPNPIEPVATSIKRTYLDMAIRDWREDEVVAFLKANGYQSYIRSFKQQCITTGANLLRLGREDMAILRDETEMPMNEIKVKMLLGAISDLKN